MPPNLVTGGSTSAGPQPTSATSLLGNAKGLLNVENLVNQAGGFLPDRRRSSIDLGETTLNIRNLLCLRALLNLAIALGSTLGASWTIIIETMQKADRVLAASSAKYVREVKGPSGSSGSSSGENTYWQQIGTEIASVQSAVSRLLESTTFTL